MFDFSTLTLHYSTIIALAFWSILAAWLLYDACYLAKRIP